MIRTTPVAFPRYCATGVIHVHTTRSDGRGEPGVIVEAALEAGLDYLAFNDHRHLALMDEGWHGKRTDGLLSIVGAELQHTDLKSHLLVYGVDRLNHGGHILSQLEEVNAMGGIAVIAHPREKRPFVPGLGEYPWGFGTGHPVAGIEVWNWMSMWKRRVSPLNILSALNHPDARVISPCAESVDMWMDTGGCLVGGADAHGHRILGRDVFNYGMLFQRVRTHILLDEPLTAPEQFTEALRQGNCFISNAISGDASGFRTSLTPEGLHMKLPGEGEVLIRGREPEVHTGGLVFFPDVKPPVYLEVRRNGRTWIAQGRAVRKFVK